MGKPRILIVATTAALVICGLWLFYAQRSALPNSVVVTLGGSTNVSPGVTLFTFQITNGMTMSLAGNYAAEVFKNGFWQNASPQVAGAGDPFWMSAHEAKLITFSAPAEHSKWRVVVGYNIEESSKRARLRRFFRINMKPDSGVAFSQEMQP